VPNGVDTEYFKAEAVKPEPAPQPPYSVVFTGNMSYAPNVDAARFLVEEVMPTVWKSFPDAKVLIAGADPRPSVRALANKGPKGCVTVSGRMDDIRDAYTSAAVFVAPMRIGSGMQNKLLEAMSMDYVRTARAKGLKPFRVICIHALRNALNPVVTAVSGWFASLLAGAVFVEYVFDWKGIGVVVVDALDKYDFPVIMGAVLLIAVMLIIVNIVVDIIYGFIDPRVRIS
jgi:glycosyltransferase involved in cell wall biosynthesis